MLMDVSCSSSASAPCSPSLCDAADAAAATASSSACAVVAGARGGAVHAAVSFSSVTTPGVVGLGVSGAGEHTGVIRVAGAGASASGQQ
uniref:Uncharacterized protein n=1 Tax=Arundo donax TaxID=35708 RepID=A0A0A9BQQ3_ARUDO